MEIQRISELDSLRNETNKYNSDFIDDLEGYGIQEDEKTFDPHRYVYLKRIIEQLSRQKRSVQMISMVMRMIFVQDLTEFAHDPEQMNEKILIKFVLCQKLAKSCKISIQELLNYSSVDILGRIAHLIIISSKALEIIDYFIGTPFFLNCILPRAWFYLLRKELINANNINQSFFKLKIPDIKNIIRNSLYECIAKISYTSQLSHGAKKNMLNLMKQVFQFSNDQELQELYKSRISPKLGYFESQVMKCLMKKLGFGKNYYLERLMTEKESQKTLPFYRKKDQLQNSFLRRKAGQDEKQLNNFLGALEFLNKEIKKTQHINNGEAVVCFLDTFHFHDITMLQNEEDEMIRQGILMQFIRTVEILVKKGYVDDDQQRTSFIITSLYILKIGIQKEDTVEMAMFSMQILLNAMGLKNSLDQLTKFFSIAVHAFLQYPHNQKVKKYTSKILSYYIKDKQQFSQTLFQDIQFLLLQKLQDYSPIKETVVIIAQQLYQTHEDISSSLKYLFSSLHYVNEDQKILNTMYILELLEQLEQNDIRKVLLTPDVLKNLYQNILDLPQAYKTEQNKELSRICAKIVACIGLCQPFVNDPLTLKATNQTTLIGKKRNIDSNKPDSYGGQNVTRSEHFNPISNMGFRKQDQQEDNALELLAVPTLADLEIERKDVIRFAEQLYNKIMSITYSTDESPKSYFFALFGVSKFIYQQRYDNGKLTNDISNDDHRQFLRQQEFVVNTVFRYIQFDISQYKELVSFKIKKSLKSLAIYLITKIQEKDWQDLFIACIPLLQRSREFLEIILPYLIYYAIRFNTNEPTLPKQIGDFMNEVLDSEHTSLIVAILKAQDFLQISLQQDKKIFKNFVEKQTKFKYIEKLFYVEMDATKSKDNTVQSFVKTVEGDIFIKNSFLAVQKIKALFNQIDKQKKIKGAQTVKNFKRCIYNFEDNYRSLINQSNKGFLDILSQEEAIEIVSLMKKLNPEDYDSPFFNSIIQTFKMNISFQQKVKLGLNQQSQQMSAQEFVGQIQDQLLLQSQQLKNKINDMFSVPHINDFWKNGQWEYIQEWMEGLDITEMYNDKNLILLDRDSDLSIQRFEYLIAIFVGEYSKGLKHYLQSDETCENVEYLRSLKKIDMFFKMLYHEFMINLDEQQGEIQYFYKLFLHVIYELESAVYYMKDIFIAEKEKLQEALRKEVNKDKRKFEKIYYEFDMKKYFEKLMAWFEERSLMIQSSTDSLKLIYFTRRMIFKLFDRDNEYAYYLMRLARLYRKTSNDFLTISKMFKECGEMSHRIIDYELEYAKYTLKTTNAHDAYRYLQSQMDNIQRKCDDFYKATQFNWLPQKIYEKSFLFNIQLQIKYDPRNAEILSKFENFLKNLNTNKEGWEKPFFKFAQYLDCLDQPVTGIQQQLPQQQIDPKKRTIQKIFYYINSLKYGHKYIWQSLPRTLELWFQYNDQELEVQKINDFMKQELNKLEIYKLATVLQILLSRYGHQKEPVRETIIGILAKIAITYPGQCAWWIFHFLHFEQESGSTANNKRNQSSKQQAISRAQFAKDLLNKIHVLNEQSYKKILECEKIFVDLKKLSEKSPAANQATTMEMPQTLSRVSASHLVMPIEENLSPQLPPANYRVNFQQTSLVCTTEPITHFNQRNVILADFDGQNPSDVHMTDEKMLDFPAYKTRPVTIAGFLPEATIMISKEKPKKIGIIGSDKNIYNFLLKCDKYGDLRKEQRFIDFAVLCNKMLESDSESRKRNLKLRTYAIVPLSRNSGLIEWIQNTNTLKSLVGDYWKKNNIKGEMHDIKNKALALKAGETHSGIWHIVKEEIRPVLGSYMAEHYPSPALWYEARINFIRSTAMWSMIGYVIGLGDRHGDNILIHYHTGEVTHVDFDCIFEKGVKLKIPEIVPFRLTQNIIDAFGIFKEKGVFQRTCEVVQRVLRKNTNNITSFLYSFIHDPLIESTNNIKVDINEALDIVTKKLYGQIHGEKGGSVTIEEQVEQVILNAINDESLSKMYIGWMPWL